MKRYMKRLGICLLALYIGVLFTRCEKDRLMINIDAQKPEGDGICGTVKDYDGNEYDVVKLGNQEWMAQNLRTTHYANGTSIPLGSSASTTTAYRYCPDNNSTNVSKYGYLYNWKAVMGNSSSSSSNPSHVQGICPNGWHVPSDAEWTELRNYVQSSGFYIVTSGSVAKALASTEDWNPPYDSYNDVGVVGYHCDRNNSTGFSALPAGTYDGDRNSYGEFGDITRFWSATEINYYIFFVDYDLVGSGSQKSDGLSVRCVKD